YMFNSRQKNIGWRIDYFLLSKRLKDKLIDSYIYSEVEGSDHCPIGIKIDL
ncbi:MAG TPA: exodeoxyribonuclease III, partial [Bacilli bacterium]